MKKILFSIFAIGLVLTSCDMDQNRPGSMTDTEAIESVANLKSFRNGIYSSIRTLASGEYITNTEIQMDQFNLLAEGGGQGMRMSTASFNSSSDEVTGPYQGCYSVLKNVNFALQRAEILAESGRVSEYDMPEFNRYIGEIHFFRAYIYYYLFDHYCVAYDPAKGEDPALGLQLVTKYDPTGDTSKYPGRSTMNATIELINSDLATAYDYIKAFEDAATANASALLKPNANYVSSLCVAAMQARVALSTKDYATAVTKSQEVINSQVYALAEDEDYEDMWATDEGSELIWAPFVDAQEAAYVGSFMSAFAFYQNYPTRVTFAPSARTLNAYGTTSAERRKDVRWSAFISARGKSNPLQIGSTMVTGYIFTKFPGNPALVSGTNYYKNAPKPFRIAEQYLILAEAAAENGQSSIALRALNDLRKARITGYSDASYAGETLINAIRDERAKELIGEGFRMSDLRRWGLGFTRDGSNPGSESMQEAFVPGNLTIVYAPNDYRYTWPIPYDEMQISPALAGQQNPGWD